MPQAERRQRRNNHLGTIFCRGRNPQFAAQSHMAAPDVVLQIFRCLQQREATLIKQRPGFSQRKPSGRSQQQRNAQLALQLPDVKTDHGLGLPEGRRRRGKTAALHHRHKHGHPLQVQHHIAHCQKISDSIYPNVAFIRPDAEVYSSGLHGESIQ